MREHLAFHDRLHFTTEVGKYTKLVELLAELQFPEVVCLQEAYDLVEISRGGKSALTDRMYSMFADKSGLGVLAFSFDAQMSRHRRAGTPSTRRARRRSWRGGTPSRPSRMTRRNHRGILH